MRNIKSMLVIVALLFGTVMTAQDVKPSFEKQGELIKGTFYYEDGSIRQEGTYKDGKLHGEWISYDANGKKIALAQYEEGNKTGKWFFWSADKLTEVDYNDNQIADVTSYTNTSTLVSRN
ncbi:nicotinic acid mononucleotide adenyltransferase [Gillisia sp. M10.2A]|uniref:Nicotinic acid mononucleotide adenyltransferase n=1 Tax=Gillisia lutea TaxID=2909668 RepID=A0ABS9EBR4_9FLAO|nr:nicotinic acid mononucleotide adenyltransferase [Gillisia lutea]MCF4100313.1 nicotinic acid mononucleotide adenyltransferase [Gillisia lutea]